MIVAELVEFTEERRGAIVSLLGVLNDGLPAQRGTKKVGEAGFVNEPRARTCPDCLANGRVPTPGCEMCNGAGAVAPNRLGSIAAPDVLDDDGETRDPYQRNDTRAYGLTGERHDRDVQIDAAISRASMELRRFPGFRPQSDRDEIAEAGPEPWERERAKVRASFDIDRMTAALDALRDRDPAACSLIHSVYVYGDPWELNPLVEERLVDGLRFLSERLPAALRHPGMKHHPAAARVKDRRVA